MCSNGRMVEEGDVIVSSHGEARGSMLIYILCLLNSCCLLLPTLETSRRTLSQPLKFTSPVSSKHKQ